MPKVRRVDYSPDEYVSGVGGVLRADEQGIYWMICSLIMSAGGPIVRDDRRIASLCLVRPAYAHTVIDRLVDIGKLSLASDGRLAQKRALSEVERSSNRIQTAIENGAKGGRPKQIDEQNQADEKATGFSPAKLTPTSTSNGSEVSNETSSPKGTKARSRRSYTAKFEAFWSAYPTDGLMSKAEAGKAFEALPDEDQDAAIGSIPAFMAYCSQHADYRPVHAVRYLTQRRFEGFNAVVAKVNSKVFVRMGTDLWEALRRHRNVVSLQHSDRNGERGWYFEKTEIEAARSQVAH